MAEFAPVFTVADLATLNDDEIVAGYRAGRAGEPEPVASTTTRSFWHGWRNGAMDSGRLPHDEAACQLCAEFVASQRAAQEAAPWAAATCNYPPQ